MSMSPASVQMYREDLKQLLEEDKTTTTTTNQVC